MKNPPSLMIATLTLLALLVGVVGVLIALGRDTAQLITFITAAIIPTVTSLMAAQYARSAVNEAKDARHTAEILADNVEVVKTQTNGIHSALVQTASDLAASTVVQQQQTHETITGLLGKLPDATHP